MSQESRQQHCVSVHRYKRRVSYNLEGPGLCSFFLKILARKIKSVGLFQRLFQNVWKWVLLRYPGRVASRKMIRAIVAVWRSLYGKSLSSVGWDDGSFGVLVGTRVQAQSDLIKKKLYCVESKYQLSELTPQLLNIIAIDRINESDTKKNFTYVLRVYKIVVYRYSFYETPFVVCVTRLKTSLCLFTYDFLFFCVLRLGDGFAPSSNSHSPPQIQLLIVFVLVLVHQCVQCAFSYSVHVAMYSTLCKSPGAAELRLPLLHTPKTHRLSRQAFSLSLSRL